MNNFIHIFFGAFKIEIFPTLCAIVFVTQGYFSIRSWFRRLKISVNYYPPFVSGGITILFFGYYLFQKGDLFTIFVIVVMVIILFLFDCVRGLR